MFEYFGLGYVFPSFSRESSQFVLITVICTMQDEPKTRVLGQNAIAFSQQFHTFYGFDTHASQNLKNAVYGIDFLQFRSIGVTF